MKKLRDITILSILGVIVLCGQNTFEIFPLKINLHYTYDYYKKDLDRSMLISWPVAIDSGLVDYVIKDSIKINDSTISWSVLEIKNIYRWKMLPSDTSYFVRDTTNLELLENTSGFHNIKIAGLLWRFPFLNPTENVFRFYSISQIEIGHQWATGLYPFGGQGTDSIKLNSSLGLYHSYSSYFTGTSSNGSSGYTRIELRGTPTITAKNNANPTISFNLEQNYPNPFNPTTIIEFELSSPSLTTLKIYDVLGREVAMLLSDNLKRGRYSYVWDASNYSSGVYFYCLQTENYIQTKKLLLQK